MLRCLILALVCVCAQAQGEITIADRREISPASVPLPSHRMVLTLAYLEGSGWAPEAIQSAALEAGRILAQCGIAVARAELIRVRAPERFLDFVTPVARELARAVPLERPTVWFVRDSRQRPAFDAEAIGRANSRTRSELADSVWVTLGTRDLGIAVTHELVHVLTDSGEHSQDPGNLMREETAPENTRLSAKQCARLRDTATANGLLVPRGPYRTP
jgi:hypothetical protein